MMVAAKAVAPLPVKPGTVTFRSSVTVRFEIAP
jgi:uncharacterized protein YggE